MNSNLESIYAAVQTEADATEDFGRRELAGILVVTVGIGLILTLIGALL